MKDVSSLGQNHSFGVLATTPPLVIVKASSGPRYVVSFRPTIPVAKLKAGTRVSLDMTTLTIMRILPREVDPMVYKMSLEDPGGASFAGIGGLGDQVRELREVRYRLVSQTPHLSAIMQGYRASAPKSRTLCSCRHHTAERRTSIWPSWHRKDTVGASCSRYSPNKFP